MFVVSRVDNCNSALASAPKIERHMRVTASSEHRSPTPASTSMVCHSWFTTICTGWMCYSGCNSSLQLPWPSRPPLLLGTHWLLRSGVWGRRAPPASACDQPVAVNWLFHVPVAARLVLVSSRLRIQQSVCNSLRTIYAIQLLSRTSFDGIWLAARLSVRTLVID